VYKSSNKALVRTQTTLRFVCAAQLGRYAAKSNTNIKEDLNMATSETIDTAGGKPVYLDKCDDILPLDRLCHTVRFSQFLLPGCTTKEMGKGIPGHHYAIVQPHYLGLDAKEEIQDEHLKETVEKELKRLERHMPITRDLRDGKLPDPNGKGDVTEMRRAIAKQAPNLCAVKLNDDEVRYHYQRIVQRAQRQEMKRILAPLRRHGIVSDQVASIDDFRRVVKETLFPSPFQPPKSPFPPFTFCLVFEQEWYHKGYTRGERINTIGLAPGEELTLEVHSWTKETLKSERELAVEAEMTLSNRLTARDHLEVASKIATQTNADVNAKINVTMPVESIPVGVGAGANLGSAINTALDSTVQQTRESTKEAVNTLKSQRKLRIEEARETGRDEKQLRKVANTNRCHTLNIHYFEVMSNFEVTLKLADVVPCVLLSMPKDVVTPAWVLCHEHILKTELLDKVFLPGFEAAKTLETKAALERIAEESPSLPPSNAPTAPTNRHEEEMQRHRQAILDTFNCLLENEEDAKDNIDQLSECGINIFCIGSELGLLVSRLPKLIYSGLLRVNSSAFNALNRLRSDQNTTPALEAIRNFFTSVTPRDYQYNVITSTLTKALDEIGIPEAIVNVIINYSLIDYVDDDCGLYVAVKAAYERLRGLEAALQSADFEQQAATTFEEGAASPVFAEPEAPISRLTRAEAEVEFNRLKCHIEENRTHYFTAIWSRTDINLRRTSLFPQLDCLLQKTPIGFIEGKAAYPITQPELFERWFKFSDLEGIKEKWESTKREPLKVSLPTSGLITEATVGQCNACEDYIIESRLIDLRQRGALASQEEAEAKRREERIEAGQLDPFDPCCTKELTQTTEETHSIESTEGNNNG